MQKNNTYAISFVSSDSYGIVADVTKILYEKGFNIADSSSTLLQGVFSMIFIVSSPENYTEDDIIDMFTTSKYAPRVFKYKNAYNAAVGEHYNISVYGADKAGIVHAVAEALAKKRINIIDLQTHLNKVYIMILEVIVPQELENWQGEIEEVAKKIGTDITITKIETYEM